MNIDFSNMLLDYQVDVAIETYSTVTNNNGGYDEETGEVIRPSVSTNVTREDFRAVVLPYSQNELYQSGGRLSTQSRKMITNRLLDIKTTVITGPNKYSIEGMTDYTNFATFIEYELKWVSAFG